MFFALGQQTGTLQGRTQGEVQDDRTHGGGHAVYKGDASKKYGSENGVIIITTKKYILDTFYKNNIENSSLKKEIPTTEILAKIGVFGSKADSKNLPYDELIKYVDTNTVNDTVLKIASITFIKPLDAQKINPDWKFGALEIKPSVTE